MAIANALTKFSKKKKKVKKVLLSGSRSSCQKKARRRRDGEVSVQTSPKTQNWVEREEKVAYLP